MLQFNVEFLICDAYPMVFVDDLKPASAVRIAPHSSSGNLLPS